MLNKIKHRLILFNLIKDIYQSPLRNFLGFKGGTMAYFFYGLDRFSVDLDFDLLKKTDKEEIDKNLLPILTDYGEILENINKHYTYFYLLSYEKGERKIKIEISKRESDVSYIRVNFYGVDVKIQKIEDAFAKKLLACTTRKSIAFRDFYDVLFYFKKGIIPNEKIIKKETGKNLKEYLDFLLRFVKKNVTNDKVLAAIGELIDSGKKESIKKNFKEELISTLSFFIDQRERF